MVQVKSSAAKNSRTANTHVIQMSQTMGRYVKANRTLCTSVPVLNITYTNQRTHENIQRFLSIILKHHVQGG